MRRVCLPAATLAALAAGCAGALGASSPAHGDASAALSGARTAVETAAIRGLLGQRAVDFSFDATSGTCPPGQSNGNYCVGASGKLIFILELRPHGGAQLQAARSQVSLASGSAISVDAKLSHRALAALRRARRHHRSVRATLSAEAIISASAYYTATGSVTLR